MIYKVGDFYIHWPEENFHLSNDAFMGKFITDKFENKADTIEYCTIYENIEKINVHKMLHYNSSSELYETPKGKFIIYHWAKCRYAIAYYLEDLDKKVVKIYFNPKMKEQLPITADWFFSIGGLHHILLKQKSPVLHASYIAWDEEAILFTAPSQTGKSTQARLWQTFENAQIINDDRVLIRKKDNVWKAYGYPSCGSSKICINKTLPIKAIVILEQSQHNEVVKLNENQKIKYLMSGIEVFTWDINEIDDAINIAKKMAKEINVIQLKCRIDQDAVYVLKTYLQGKG